MRRVGFWIGTALCFCATPGAQAQGFSGLFASGVDADSQPLADGSIDPHYVLAASADSRFSGPQALLIEQGMFPFPTWVANSTASRWIGVQSGNAADAADGKYIFRTVFSLADADPTMASLGGSWACDDTCSVRLNGTDIATVSSAGYLELAAFAIPTGAPFVLGMNTLEFVVTNSSEMSPTGLRPMGLRIESLVGKTTDGSLVADAGIPTDARVPTDPGAFFSAKGLQGGAVSCRLSQGLNQGWQGFAGLGFWLWRRRRKSRRVQSSKRGAERTPGS